MEDLRRIQSPVVTPQPVGGGSRNQPGSRRKDDEFRDIIDRERGREPGPEAEEEGTGGASPESPPADASGENASADPERGLLIDERA